MSIAVDGSTPARWAGAIASGDGITSASFTAPTDALLILCANSDGSTAGGVGSWTPVVTDSGGLSWTERVTRSISESVDGGASTIWTARTTSSVSRTVTWDPTWTGGATLRQSAKLYVLTGVDVDGTPVDSVGANNEGGSAANPLDTTSITPGANGLLFVVDTDWSALGTQTSSDLTIDTAHYAGEISVGSGYKTTTNGVGVTGNIDPPAGTPQLKWCQVTVREFVSVNVQDPIASLWPILVAA